MPEQSVLELEEAHGGAAANLLAIAWQRKALVVLGTVVGLVVAALYFAQQTPQYRAGAQIMVIKRGNPLPTTGRDPRTHYYEDYLASHVELIRSPIIVRKAVEKHRLYELASFAGGGDPTGAIRGGITAKRSEKGGSYRGSNILNLTFQTTVPEDCPVVLDAVIDSYRDFLKEAYKTVSDDALHKITTATEELRKDLAVKEKAYEEFREKHGRNSYQGTEGNFYHEQWLTQIQNRLLNLRVRRAELFGRIQVIENALKDGRGRQALLALISSDKSTAATGERRIDEQLFELMLKEQLLLADYGPDHPEVKSVRKRMALTQEFFARNIDGKVVTEPVDPVQWHLRSLHQELKDADVSLQALGMMFDKEQEESRKLDDYKDEDQKLRNKLARARKLFEPIILRLEEVELVRNVGGYDARTIAPPGRGGPVGLKLLHVLLAGAVMGTVAGFGLAYLAEVTDKSFRTPHEIRHRLGLPVVGHIPFLTPDQKATQIIAAGDASLDPLLYAYHRPKSVQAEAYRGVRTALYFSTQGATHQVIQVTSPNASDGKSTLSTNLAISIAQSGKKVVLLDADFRKPRLHKIFAISPTTGLAEVVAGTVEWKDAVIPTVVPGLTLFPCGPRPHNPAELLTSPQFEELINVVREQYDFVIIDTPPLLAVSDPSIVAPRVDGVILTIRVSKNGRPGAERAKEILTSVQANVIGVVVNGAGQDRTNYGYNQYNYSYRYRYTDQYHYGYRSEGNYYHDETGGEAAAEPESSHRPADDRPHPPSRRPRTISPDSDRGFLHRWFTWWSK